MNRKVILQALPLIAIGASAGLLPPNSTPIHPNPEASEFVTSTRRSKTHRVENDDEPVIEIETMEAETDKSVVIENLHARIKRKDSLKHSTAGNILVTGFSMSVGSAIVDRSEKGIVEITFSDGISDDIILSIPTEELEQILHAQAAA
jgi:hypothetical protein